MASEPLCTHSVKTAAYQSYVIRGIDFSRLLFFLFIVRIDNFIGFGSRSISLHSFNRLLYFTLQFFLLLMINLRFYIPHLRTVHCTYGIFFCLFSSRFSLSLCVCVWVDSLLLIFAQVECSKPYIY